MRRPYLAYLAAAVLPSVLTVGVGTALARGARRELGVASQTLVGRMALAAAEEDLAAGLAPSAAQVGRVTGYRITFIVDGRPVSSTEPAPPPEGVDGALRVSGERTGAAGSLAVVVAPGEPSGPALPLAFLLVTGLLLLFASLAGWIQLSGGHRGGRTLSLLLLSALPALAAWGFLVQADRLYRRADADAERRDLTRALAVARLRGVAGEPTELHRLTGFHAWRVQGGAVTASSVGGPAADVAALPAPPPSFTSTGKVATAAGEASYVALRLPEGGFTAVVAPPSAERSGRFSKHAAWAAAALAAWLLVAGALAAAGRKRFSSGR